MSPAAGLLAGLLVVEVGTTWAGRLCGGLLSELGAEVVRLVPASEREQPAVAQLLDSGKRVLAVDAGARGAAREALGAADVVLEGPVLPAWLSPDDFADECIHCVVTPFGMSGPLAGRAGGELVLQALTGLLHVTGYPDEDPVRIGPPVVEHATALFALIAVLAALGERADGGRGQLAQVAAFDCAVFYLNAYIPIVLAGGTPSRPGNRGTTTVPWNEYPTADGAVVICTSTDAQWEALLALTGREDLRGDPRFATASDRLAHADAVDAVVAEWTSRRATEEVLSVAAANRIAAGVVAPVSSVVARRAAAPRPLLSTAREPTAPFARVAEPRRPDDPPFAGDAGRRDPGAPPAAGDAARRDPGAPPLAGVRVIEIGHYTAGPYCGRVLSGLGADVVKVEPPGGEPMRRFRPLVGGDGQFFHLNNASKRTVTLDLRTPAGIDALRRLVAESDVLIENLSGGALDRLGLGYDAARALNPRLIYCSIKGFGAHGPDARRLAYDTIIQAEGGLMAATGWPSSGPVRAGISISDLLGSTLAAADVVAALLARRATGQGRFLDVSMLEATAWTTDVYAQAPPPGGNRHPLLAPQGAFAARDGAVAIAVDDDVQWAALADLLSGDPPAGVEANSERLRLVDAVEALVAEWVGARTVAEAVADCARAGVPAAPVLTVGEVLEHEHTKARELLVEAPVADGSATAALLTLPISLSRSLIVPPSPIGPLGADGESVLAERAS